MNTTLPGQSGILPARPEVAVTRYVRFLGPDGPVWGVLDGENVQPISAAPWSAGTPSGDPVALSQVKLLAPADPPKILAVGLNYRSHLGTRPQPENPEMFYKPVTALQNPDGPIVIPPNAENLHYEAEMVLVIGARTRNATPEQARAAIFGITCGNDVSERDWQKGDRQWWRAKGCDTFAPCGPVLVRGLDDGNLRLTGRLNGEVVQDSSTSDLLFDPVTIVTFVSRHLTLEPGDLIYTGTPGSTRKMNPGDIFEVELEGVGVLRNIIQSA